MALLKIVSQDSVTICDKSNTFIANVIEYQQTGKFCDITLCAPEQKENEDKLLEIPGHSCILASGSPFMHDILLREPLFQQKGGKRLVFKNMNGKMLKLCVDFLYGREVKVNTEEIIPLKCAADVLKIDGLVRHCMLCMKTVAKKNDSFKTAGSDLKSSSETPHNASLPIIHVKMHVETPIPKIKNKNSVCNLEKEFDYDDGTNYDRDHMDGRNANSGDINNVHDVHVMYATTQEDPSKSKTGIKKKNKAKGGKPKSSKRSKSSKRKYANKQEKNRVFHEKEKQPKICSHCGVTFRNYRTCLNHMKEVEGKVLYCQYCTKTFLTKSQLTEHEMRHQDKRNFACDQCDYRAVTKTELNGHKVKHNKDATIVCEICGKTMREKYLRIHKQQVHGNASKIVKGPDCPYTNPKISAVKDHVIKHDTIGWFKCSHCGQVYRHKHCLKGHLKHVHNIEVGNYALNACRLVNSTVIGDQQHLNDSANAVQTEGSNIHQKPSSQCHIENIPIDNINNTGISVEKVVFSAEVLQLQPLSTELSERKTAATADNTLNRQKVSHHSGVNYAFKQTNKQQTSTFYSNL